jgi:hypothetical protein
MFVTRHTHVVDAVLADKLWQLYDVAYQGLSEQAVTREMLYRSEFDETIADPTNRLWVLWDDNMPIGMSLVGTDRHGATWRQRAPRAGRCSPTTSCAHREGPSQVLTATSSGPRPPAEALRRRHRREHHHLRPRPGRHRQELAGRRHGGAGAADQAGAPHHPHPPGGRGGERLGFLPGDLMAKVDPYLRPLYDALHDMVDPRARRSCSSGARGGGAARVHARPHAQQQLHHPRRGPEHHARADEDVPHPHRVRLEGGRHRRHHPGRRARRAQRPGGLGATLTASTGSPSCTSRATWCATASSPTSSTPTSAPTRPRPPAARVVEWLSRAAAGSRRSASPVHGGDGEPRCSAPTSSRDVPSTSSAGRPWPRTCCAPRACAAWPSCRCCSSPNWRWPS